MSTGGWMYVLIHIIYEYSVTAAYYLCHHVQYFVCAGEQYVCLRNCQIIQFIHAQRHIEAFYVSTLIGSMT